MNHHDPEMKAALLLLRRKKWEKTLKQINHSLNTGSRKPSRISRMLYWAGLAMIRTGYWDEAVRSWRIAVRLAPGSFSARASQNRLTAHVNEYGMPRQKSSELDDWRAFHAIQTERYLAQRHGRFGSRAEKDMVTELLASEWGCLKKEVPLKSLTVEKKTALFRRIRIVFPLFIVGMDSGSSFLRDDFEALEDQIDPVLSFFPSYGSE